LDNLTKHIPSSVALGILIALLIPLDACQTRGGFEKQLAAWNGRPVKEWVAERGGPNWIKDAPDGAKLYAWQFGEARTARAGGTSMAGVPGMSASERTYSVCTVTLVVRNEVIIDSRFEGDACVGSAP